MRQVLDDTLSLGAKNAVVHAFKKLVYNSLGKDFKSEDKNATSNTTIPPRYVAELDKDLYNKAVSLPEALTVSLDKTSNVDKYQYGIFAGGTVYKTLDGDIDENNKDVRQQEGWLILDRSSTEYALFVADSGTYIIAISSFTPTPIVKDFKPLYDKLSETKHTNTVTEDSVKNDKQHIGALAVTYRDDVSNIVTSYTEEEYSYTEDVSHQAESGSSSGSGGGGDDPGGSTSYVEKEYGKILPLLSSIDACAKVKLYQAWLLFMNAALLWESAILLKENLEDRLKRLTDDNAGIYGLYPKQLESKIDSRLRNSFEEVQAVVYVIKDDTKVSSVDDVKYADGTDFLMCYQTPETISYTSQANYEPVSTRGSQIPLQYYNNANQIDLSFTLKWHIDEVKTFVNNNNLGEYFYRDGFQTITQIADSFTRPWDADGANKRKLCKVILPSITHIGYITSVQIQYSGDMVGSRLGILKSGTQGTAISGDDMLSANDNGEAFNSPTEYGYNMLEITFNMIVVQDINLLPCGESLTSGSFPMLVQGTIGERTDAATKVIQSIELGADIVTAGANLAEAVVNMGKASAELFSL